MIATLAMSSIANAITIEVLKGDTPSKLSCPAKVSKIFNESPVININTDKTLSPEQIKQRIANVSRKYGLDYEQMVGTIACESSWDVNAYNHKDAKWGGAYGISQFLPRTWEHGVEKYGCSGSYNDPNDQLDCMARFWKAGKQKWWTCWRVLYDNKTVPLVLSDKSLTMK